MIFLKVKVQLLKAKNMVRNLICLLLLSPSLLFAQQSIEAGDIYYDFFQYKEAIREYENALKNNRTFKNEAHLLTNLAYSYAYTFQYEKAEEKFAELVKIGDKKPLPDIYLDYGVVLKVLGKYEKAREQFTFYTTLVKGDEYTSLLMKSLNWAEKYKDSIRPNTYVGLTNLNIGGQSLGYAYFAEGILYAHPRDTQYSEYTTLYDLQYATMIDTVTFAEKRDEYVGSIKFPYNEGAPSVSFDGELLYFTATANKTKKGIVKKVGKLEISEDGVSNLKIYVSKFENGQFEGIVELPFNDKQFNCTHPFISRDGNTLYFVSDMPGGFGGLDIYKSEKGTDGKWGKPVNMGAKVNTTEHETYPYLADGYLYFSSKGHVGFGGYDLFQSALDQRGSPVNVKNMGKPFNSTKDDVAFIIAGDGITGYFSSNRDNNEGIDKVYYFRDNYAAPTSPSIAQVNTPVAKQIPITLASKQPVAKEPTVNNQSLSPEVGKTLSVVLYAFNNVDLQQAFKEQLDSIVVLAKLFPQLKINIHAYADCRGSEAYNMALSKRRAQSTKKYLVGKGFKAGNIGMVSYGEGSPKISCNPCEACSEEQHKENRRVEIKIAK